MCASTTNSIAEWWSSASGTVIDILCPCCWSYNRLGDSVRLLLAEFEGRVIAGGLFFRDGHSVLYWHGASDRTHSERFASRPLFDEAIRWGNDIGATSVNLGGSAGVASVERFKSMWGARVEMNRTFEWTNPLWRALSTSKAALGRRRVRCESRAALTSDT